jgi:hypothetical protein
MLKIVLFCARFITVSKILKGGVYSELCVSDFMEKKTRMVSMSWQMKPLILGRNMEILTLEMSIRSRLLKILKGII